MGRGSLGIRIFKFWLSRIQITIKEVVIPSRNVEEARNLRFLGRCVPRNDMANWVFTYNTFPITALPRGSKRGVEGR